jgi:hypothetical protein
MGRMTLNRKMGQKSAGRLGLASIFKENWMLDAVIDARLEPSPASLIRGAWSGMRGSYEKSPGSLKFSDPFRSQTSISARI